jgi:hypothetical protein
MLDTRPYTLHAPRATHTRAASCEESGCLAHRYGWTTAIDEMSELGARQADYIRRRSGRAFAEHRDERGLTTFTFGAGQECFTEHRVRLERAPLYIIGQTDRVGADEWVDRFNSRSEQIEEMRSRG